MYLTVDVCRRFVAADARSGGAESLISLIFDPNFNASIFGASSLRCVTGNRQNSPHTLDGLGFDATHFQLTGNHFDKFFGALDIL